MVNTRSPKFLEAARWLLDEHRLVEKMTQELEDLSHEPRGGRQEWLDRLKSTFEQFHAHVLRHFDLEEVGGYLAQVIEARPTMAPRVDQLADEHRQLKPILSNLRAMLDDCRLEDRLVLSDCCSRVRMVLGYIDRHDKREIGMVLDTHLTDLGMAD
ncbi:MAG: hypothetical protein BIFFINMI_03544 [Phycisphaerae bacterium]|nr:hypothetical protein [Phycisphaerae bacterium]